MKRFSAILTLVTALCIGWIPVLAAPARLASEERTQVYAQSHPAGHAQHARECDKSSHCGSNSALHPALCSACIAVPGAELLVSIAAKPGIVVPRGHATPLIAGVPAPLPPPPKH